jgi:hypothetical protein
MLDPAYVTVDVQATVFPTPNFAPALPAVLDPAIRAALTTLFAIRSADGSLNTAIDFGFNLGGELPISDVFNAVRDVNGVRKIGDTPASFLLNSSDSDVALEPFEFPVLGTVTLINGDTGAPLL